MAKRCTEPGCLKTRTVGADVCQTHLDEEQREEEQVLGLRVCEHCGAIDGTPHESNCQSAVDHPDHYGGEDNPYEAIKVIEAWELDFCLGNTVKYIARAGKKDPTKELEDLQKARWYLERRIQQLS